MNLASTYNENLEVIFCVYEKLSSLPRQAWFEQQTMLVISN